MVLRPEQIRVLAALSNHNFEEELMGHSRKFAPGLCAMAGPENTRKAVHDALQNARLHGFTLRGPLRLFFEMTLSYGAGFDTDPQLRWAAEQLANRDFDDEMLRAAELFRRSGEYWDAVMGPKHEHADAALTRLLEWTRSGWPDPAAGFERLLDWIFPEKRQAMDDEAARALLAAGEELAAGAGVRRPADRALLLLLLLLFGHSVAEDPMYPWVVRTFGEPAEHQMAALRAALVDYAERSKAPVGSS